MASERWDQVESLLHAALSQPVAERADFLRDACGGDEALQREVESLLGRESEADDFLESPLAALAADLTSSAAQPALVRGQRLGPYVIAERLGAGGMGEVYRATDTNLKRQVAIKVLPESFAADADRLARFLREAEVLAALNHPNIAHIYGLERQLGAAALILELVEGEDLSQRISHSAIPIDEALQIAKQIAEALEAAHDQGIIHRDLKPANIKVRSDGTVKVLDFGLAKALEAPAAASPSLSMSPTITTPAMTAAGMILGTAAYMSPEQARGSPVDKRTDIWAFGCVLYEMLTGRTAFGRATITDTLAAILEREPSWERLPDRTPPSVRSLLRRSLQKDVRRRLRDIADARLELDDAAVSEWDTNSPPPQPKARERIASRFTGVAAGLLLVVLLAGLVVTRLGETGPGSREVTRSVLAVTPAEQLRSMPEDQTIGEGRPSQSTLVLSPDGRTLVFSAVRSGRQQLYQRALDQLDAIPIAGTEEGTGPFFSFDGKWVGFWASGALKKVVLDGGNVATTICDTAPVFGASWGSNDTIVFARMNEGLLQVSATGGTPRPLTALDPQKGEVSHRLPQILPGNQAVLFTVTRLSFPKWEETAIVVQSLATGERRELAQGADARYVRTGHLLYMRAGKLMAVPFDLTRLAVTGGAVALIDGVMQAANMRVAQIDSGAAQFSVSANGTLVYVPGGIFPNIERSLVWVDRVGTLQPLPLPTRAYAGPHLSPDGQRIVVWTQGTDRNIWIYEIARGTLTRLTADYRNSRPVWTPDGKSITYTSAESGADNIFRKTTDGSRAPERLTSSEHNQAMSSLSPDGQTLTYVEFIPPTEVPQIWMLSLSGDQRPRRMLQTRSNETYPEFSADGHWLAYVSDETGRNEVYVQPFPGPGPKHQISVEGGRSPRWPRSGHELFYLANRLTKGESGIRMMAVRITANPTFTAGTPQTLFEGQYYDDTTTTGYDVTVDGKRFIMAQPIERPAVKPSQMILVQNWFEELKARVPVK
jgi:serine/threonine-protein kinase